MYWSFRTSANTFRASRRWTISVSKPTAVRFSPFSGENGAGKSTLLKVLNGDYRPDGGKYLLNGEEKHFHTPHEAIEEGISVIYQERQILLELSVAENIYLGRMPVNKFGVINTRKANQMAQKIIEDFGLPIAATTKVKDLSIAYQQMVEIMKAYSRENLKVICFDEPTASLSDAEIDALFAIIEKLKAQGKIIIYVSHRIERDQADRGQGSDFQVTAATLTPWDAKQTEEQVLIQKDGGPRPGRYLRQSGSDQGDRRCAAGGKRSVFRLREKGILHPAQGRDSGLLRPGRGRAD